MSPEAQRIAISEACGKTDVRYQDGRWVYGCACSIGLPDYLHDLNAVHEAEKTLTGVQQDTYCNMLGWPADNTAHAAWRVAHATAAQRAEAFLRTLGKWDDSK